MGLHGQLGQRCIGLKLSSEAIRLTGQLRVVLPRMRGGGLLALICWTDAAVQPVSCRWTLVPAAEQDRDLWMRRYREVRLITNSGEAPIVRTQLQAAIARRHGRAARAEDTIGCRSSACRAAHNMPRPDGHPQSHRRCGHGPRPRAGSGAAWPRRSDPPGGTTASPPSAATSLELLAT